MYGGGSTYGMGGGRRGHPSEQEPLVTRLPAVCETCPEDDRRQADYLLTGPDVWCLVAVGRTRVLICRRCLDVFAPNYPL